MIDQIGIIGDIHGTLPALTGLLNTIEDRFERLVFVGDYVDRGQNSAKVLDVLVDLSGRRPETVFIAGNHDNGFRRFLEGAGVSRFLKMGGAATVRSYLDEAPGDIVKQMRTIVPLSHRQFLERMLPYYESNSGLVVTHSPSDLNENRNDDYHVFGHLVQSSLKPKIRDAWAAIDTGCGTVPNGRLTCLAWPSLNVVQVDPSGLQVF